MIIICKGIYLEFSVLLFLTCSNTETVHLGTSDDFILHYKFGAHICSDAQGKSVDASTCGYVTDNNDGRACVRRLCREADADGYKSFAHDVYGN